MQKRARVIYNPTSGRELLKQKMVDILNIFEQAGYETSAYATTQPRTPLRMKRGVQLRLVLNWSLLRAVMARLTRLSMALRR